ncbi:MAG: alpha/beta hydrolase [Pseudomonadota bacterium]|nr:alpha/beta hydrolase [Pseudomonadota bacterium]
MISEMVDGLVPSLMKRRTLSGYAATSRDGIRFMDLGSCVIRYRMAGKGHKVIVFQTDPPIVIEHYDYLINIFSQEYTVVVFETPGFGFSVPSIYLDYGYHSSIDLTERFLDRLNLGSVVFVAPCVLGYSGIGIAHKRPDLVSHLVLSQVPSWNQMLKWKDLRDPKGLLSKPVISQILLKILKRRRTPVWLEKALGKPGLHEEFNRIAQDAYKHGATFNLASGFQSLLHGESPLPSNIASKTLFLWGEKDSSHCTTCKNSSLEMIPHAKAVRLPLAGHFPELEETDLVADHLQQFIYG